MSVKPFCKTPDCNNHVAVGTNGYCAICFDRIMKIKTEKILQGILDQLVALNINISKLNNIKIEGIPITNSSKNIQELNDVISDNNIKLKNKKQDIDFGLKEFIPQINVDDVKVNKGSESKKTEKEIKQKKDVRSIISKLADTS